MSDPSTASRNTVINVSLVVLGLTLLALLFALSIRLFMPRVDPLREENTGALVGDIIQVEVRNGCGISGIAGQMTQFLRKKGFDVVEVGDHDTFNLEHSMVYDRIGDLESARKLAQAVGIPPDRVVQEIKLDEYLDASLVIGLDYADLAPYKTQ
jgi:hypothetical protein